MGEVTEEVMVEAVGEATGKLKNEVGRKKPRRGFTPGAGKEKPGWDKVTQKSQLLSPNFLISL